MNTYVVDYGVAFTAYFDIYITANPEAVATSFTPAAGDTKISTNGGTTYTATTNTCTFANGIISVALTATEMQASRILVKFEDQDAALVNDSVIEIMTKNHASAFYSSIDINVDSSGYVRLQATTHTSALIGGIAGTLQTLDALDSAQDTQHSTTQTNIAALNDISTAQVNAEVLDVLNTDTFAEPGQGTPGATVSLAAKIGYLYKAWRNRSTQTASQYTLYNDDATTVDQKATFSDDTTTADRGEVSTGP